MGEYASYNGSRVKIGTCEDLYYLRADQTGLLTDSDCDFTDSEILSVVRFRFPWPDEDGIDPGAFEDPFRSLRLWGVSVPAEVSHGTVQFSHPNGYLVNLPCPESAEPTPYVVHRNGYRGACSLQQQAYRGGQLVGIAHCNGCGAAYRLEDGYALEAIASIRSDADREIRTADDNGTEGNRSIGRRLHTIADRLAAGYRAEIRSEVGAVSAHVLGGLLLGAGAIYLLSHVLAYAVRALEAAAHGIGG